MRLLFLLLPFAYSLQAEFPLQSMLYQAEAAAKTYAIETAKAPTPSNDPQTAQAVALSSIWFTIKLNEVAHNCEESIFKTLTDEYFFDALRSMGVDGLRLVGLKKGGEQRTGLATDPQWGNTEEWNALAALLRRKGIALIGDAMGESTGIGADFSLALKNYGDYPSLYHLVEIERSDWKLLPLVPKGELVANIPWLSLNDLKKKGYITERFSPQMKESEWNATDRVDGSDGKSRRWIYLKQNKKDPVLDWLDPSFAAMRLAAGDSLDSYYRLGEKIFHFNAHLTPYAQENLALWIRKMGAFTVQEMRGGMTAYKKGTADLMVDSLTRPALLHALIAEDAEALKLMYRLFIEENIPSKRLVHALQPIDSFSCDWAEFIENPKKKFRYYNEYFTGEVLRKRLLKEDMESLIKPQAPDPTNISLCAQALGLDDYENNLDTIEKAHLLLAFFYALQPGVFSFSVSDILGALPNQSTCYDLSGCNPQTLYPSFPIQLTNACSFSSQLRKILQVRKDQNIQNGELIDVPQTCHRSVLALTQKAQDSGFTQILIINFSRKQVQETLEMPDLRNTSVINLLTGLAEDKSFNESSLKITLPPLSGKFLYFQPKYYD